MMQHDHGHKIQLLPTTRTTKNPAGQIRLCSAGVPKATLRFHSSQKRLTELSRTVTFIVTVHHCRRDSNEQREEAHKEGPGETRHKLPVVSPSGVVRTVFTSLSNVCGNTHSIAKQGNSLNLSGPGFYWGSGLVDIAVHPSA